MSLPQLVTALVLLYGGQLVNDGVITSGQLVSFLLYLSSLSDAFNMMGSMFSSLTQAVGAADKVFELMHRKPRMRGSKDEYGDGDVGGAGVMDAGDTFAMRPDSSVGHTEVRPSDACARGG